MLERVPLLEKELDDYLDVVGPEVARTHPRARPAAAGQAGPPHQRDRVRRRRRRAARHPCPAAPQRRPRRRMAGDARQRRVLRRDQAGPQRAPGRGRRVDTGDAAHLPREGPRQLTAPRRGVRLRRRPRPATRRAAALPPRPSVAPVERDEVDLALPHRPDRRQPGRVGVLPTLRRAPPRVGVDHAAVRARVAGHGAHRPRPALHRPAVGEEPRSPDAVLRRDREAVRHRPEPADRVPGEPLRPVEGPDRRHRSLPYGARRR